MNDNKGFTLIEILIVVTIIGLLTGVGLNNSMKNTRRKNLDRVVAEIEIGLRKARDDAYNGRIYDSGCSNFVGKEISITSTGYEIKDLCDLDEDGDYEARDEGVKATEFGFKDIMINEGSDVTLNFPYLTSGIFPTETITVSSRTVGKIINIEEGQIIPENAYMEIEGIEIDLRLCQCLREDKLICFGNTTLKCIEDTKTTCHWECVPNDQAI